MKNFIAREKELVLLKALLTSNRPEFVAVYGRCGIGKTRLTQVAGFRA